MLTIDTSKILDKPMNRKQFLRNVGVGVIALTGITAALRAISQAPVAPEVSRQTDSSAAMRTASAYGGSVYGGIKPRV